MVARVVVALLLVAVLATAAGFAVSPRAGVLVGVVASLALVPLVRVPSDD